MRFTIVTNKPGHQPPQSRCDFYPPGGTIGRGTDNNLVLPDNERAISRLQAIVHIAGNGECRITNRGNVTRVVLNDIPLERGRQVELQDGDVLDIDEYRIEVTDLILDTQPVSRMAANVQAGLTPDPAPAAKKENATTAVPTEIWDSLMQEFSISDSISSNRAKPEPQTLNPFAAPKAPERNPEDPLALLAKNESAAAPRAIDTDKLFNDQPLFKSDSIFDDVTPSTLVPPVEPVVKNDAPAQDELDPLALFGGAGASVQQARDDDPLGLLSGAVPLSHVDDITPPQPQAAEPAWQSPIPPQPEPLLPQDDIVPKVDPEDVQPLFVAPEPVVPEASSDIPEYVPITLPTPQTVQRAAAQTPKGRLRIDPVQSESAATTGGESSGDVLNGELLDALLEGMGLGDMQPKPQFDRENMRQLGQMLSMFSQGTVALLSSRSILKRGVKADMTMVLDDANNPFKLLPSGKTVLMQMFGTRMPGFMPPKKSVRDALIDLQAHQLGMISGIRAIIAAMLQSFNPELLEEDAKRDGATARLGMLSNRKAALWDYFVRSYAETAGEIDDDFHTLFGEAFLHAYDMEVNQYKDSQSASEEQQ